MKKTTDKKVLEMLAKIELAEKDIKKSKSPIWKTRCILTLNNKTINLHTLNKEGVYDLTLELLNLKEGREKANKFFGITQTEPFMVENVPVDDYLDDLKTRMEVILLEVKKKDLKKLKSSISSKLSEEKSTEIEVENLGNELNDLLG